MAGGRPTSYSQEMVELAEKYLKTCKDTYRFVGGKESSETKGQKASKWSETKTSTHREKQLFVKLPSIEGLAVYLKVRRSTIYDWQKAHTEFSDIVEQILAEQADRLINGGVSGRYNPSVSKLILTKHGYRDQVETKEVEDWESLLDEADKIDDENDLDANADAPRSTEAH